MDGGRHEGPISAALRRAFGVSGALSRIPAGTATDNFLVEERSGDRWFAKVYRPSDHLEHELAAIDLAMFVRDGGIPVPEIRPDATGRLIAEVDGVALSLWEFIEEAKTAEGRLGGECSASIGAVLGKMHRRLAEHPAGGPSAMPAAGLRVMERVRDRYDRLIDAYRRRGVLDEDQRWALDAALQRRALLSSVQSIVDTLPMMTGQILHGDLSSQNLLLRRDEVAAVIDFRPPSVRHLAWEIARIGCDPRTIVSTSAWVDGLSRLLDAYQQEYPLTTTEGGLRSIVSVGSVYTITSTYPLEAPLRAPGPDHARLMRYGRDRHEAALAMLDALRDGLD